MPPSADGDEAVSLRRTGPLDQFLRPKARFKRQLCMPQTALRSGQLCQQLLCAQLGWAPPPSLTTWQQAAARQHVTRLPLPPVWEQHVLSQQPQRQGITCLQVQQQQGSCVRLAAVGYQSGLLHICRLPELQAAAEAASLAACTSAATASPAAAAASSLQLSCAADPEAQQSVSLLPALTAAALPPAAVWTADTSDRLRACAWAPPGAGLGTASAGGTSGGAELVTSGGRGVTVRRFVEGRHLETPLCLRGGGQLCGAGQVAYLGPGAAYQLAAAHPGGLLLWDCRAASRAVAEIACSSSSSSGGGGGVAGSQLLQVMPGGELLLAAAADGQLVLYDVRRMSSSTSSVINFGGGRSSQQLVAAYNLPARAAEAAAAAAAGDAAGSGGGSRPGSSVPPPAPVAATASSVGAAAGVAGRGSGGVPPLLYPFFRDVQLNPADCNLVAYVRPDLQVGLFDMFHNRVLQQVCVAETLGAAATAATAAAPTTAALQWPDQAAARAVWDPAGRVLYCHGLLRQYSSGAGGGSELQAVLTPSLAAIDFGSSSGRRQRRGGAAGSIAGGAGATFSTASAGEPVASSSSSSSGGCWGRLGGGLLCRGGQVLQLPMQPQLAPSELALAGSDGALLMGTLSGDLLWLS